MVNEKSLSESFAYAPILQDRHLLKDLA